MINPVIYSHKSDDWATPTWLYNQLNKEFNFDFDPCPLYSTFNGLKISWEKRCYVNPPYSKVYEFMDKAKSEIKLGNTDIAIFLVFARTDTKWFHEFCLGSELRFIKGRINFGGKYTAIAPSMVVIMTNNKNNYTYKNMKRDDKDVFQRTI